VPALSPGLVKHIDTLLPPYWSRSNPIDLVGEHDETLPLIVIEELLKWEGCDAVINLGIMGRKHLVRYYIDAVRKTDPMYDDDFLNQIEQTLGIFEETYIQKIAKLMETYQKPVLGVSLLTEAHDRTVYMVDDSPYRGVFYTTPERAVKTLAKMVAYNTYKTKT
jgi:acyl-CoA synthetase (NDP forming)